MHIVHMRLYVRGGLRKQRWQGKNSTSENSQSQIGNIELPEDKFD